MKLTFDSGAWVDVPLSALSVSTFSATTIPIAVYAQGRKAELQITKAELDALVDFLRSFT